MGPKGKAKTGATNKLAECKSHRPSDDVTEKPTSQNVPVISADDNNSNEEALNTSKYARRKLDNNWEKYEEIESENDMQKGLNFSDFYGQKPTASSSTDSYFRFSNEKNWEVLEKFDDYFKLNISHLCREVMCVPLHERLKLTPSLVTAEQIEIFDNDAKKNQVKIKESLADQTEIKTAMLSLLRDETELKETEGWPQASKGNSDKQSTWDSNSENFFSLSGVEEELDSILSSMPLPETAPLESKSKINMLNTYFYLIVVLNFGHLQFLLATKSMLSKNHLR